MHINDSQLRVNEHIDSTSWLSPGTDSPPSSSLEASLSRMLAGFPLVRRWYGLQTGKGVRWYITRYISDNNARYDAWVVNSRVASAAHDASLPNSSLRPTYSSLSDLSARIHANGGRTQTRILPFSVFFLFPSLWMEQKKRKKKKKLSTNRPHRWAPDLGGYPSLQRAIKFWRWWAGNGGDDFLMGNFWGVLYDRKMATGVQVAGWFNFVIVMVNRSCIAIMIIY